MAYNLVSSLLFALLYAEAAYSRSPTAVVPVVAILTGGAYLLALAVPPLLFRYTNENVAPVVLTRLTRRAALGSLLVLALAPTVWLLVAPLSDPEQLPGLFGELYLFTLLGVVLFLGFGEVITRHVMYLQQTRQYDSDQLVAVLLGVTLLLFILVLYFLAFDLSRPPAPHPYLRDLLAITLALIGYGRAVYLMAHH